MADPTPVRATNHGGLAEMSAGIIKQLADLAPENDGQGLRPRFEALFRDFETRAMRGGCAETDVKMAKYALAALIDETVLLSDLPIKDEWLGRPLQMQYFDDFSAGEEFYNKLDQARLGKTPAAADVMEVYHLCLAFGFKGTLAILPDPVGVDGGDAARRCGSPSCCPPNMARSSPTRRATSSVGSR